MTFRGDERGAAIQIGAVILFAFIVIAMASYQATVVPSQNSGVEFNHNQDVQSQMVDLSTGIDASARDGTRGSHSVRLGTTYPSRTLFVNPGSPGGQLRTVETGGEIQFQDVEVSDDESDTVQSYWDNEADSVATSRIQYAPNYNEYRAAPTTVYEHGLLLNDNPEGSPTTLAAGSVVDDGELTLIALRGDVQHASSAAVSVDRRSLSSSSNTVTIDSGTIRLPTAYPDHWVSELEGREGVSADANGDFVELEIEEELELRMAKVGVGDVSSVDRDPDTRAKYVAENDDRAPTVSAEVRDEYNNPVAGAEFEYEVNDGGFEDGTTNSDGLAEVDDVEQGDTVEIRIDDDPDSWETVEIDVRAGGGSGGGSGAGGTFDIDWDTDTIQSDNDVITDCTGDTCIYNLNDGSDATLTAEASVSGATVDFSIDRNSPASLVDPEDDETGDDGTAITTLDVDTSEGEEGDAFKVHVNSGGSGDVITVELDDSDIQPTLDDETSEIDPDTTTEGEEDSFTATVELDNLDDVTEGDVTVTLVDYADGTDVEETTVSADLSGETATVTVAGDNFDNVEAPDAGDYTVEASVDDFDGDVDPIEPTQIDTITVLEPGEQADLDVQDFSGELPDGETEPVDLEEVEVTIDETADVEAENVDVKVEVIDSDGNFEGSDEVTGQTIAAGGEDTFTFFEGDDSINDLDADTYDVEVTATADNAEDTDRTESFTVEEQEIDSVDAEFDEAEVAEGEGNGNDLTITVEDQNGDAVEGEDVDLVILEGDGSLDETTVATDEDGEATATYTQGADDTAGDEVEVEADADGVTDTATYEVTSSMANQVTVTDADGNNDQEVIFTLSADSDVTITAVGVDDVPTVDEAEIVNNDDDAEFSGDEDYLDIGGENGIDIGADPTALDTNATIEENRDEEFTLAEFRDADNENVGNMNNEEVTITLEFSDGSALQETLET